MNSTLTTPNSVDHRLFSGRRAWIMVLFFGLLAVCTISGAHLYFHTARDLTRYYLIESHLFLGNVCALLLFPVLWTHIRRLYSAGLAFAAIGFTVFFYVMLYAEMGPYERFLIPLAFWAFFTARYLAFPKGRFDLAVLVGVGSLFVLVVVLATGLYFAGPVRALRTGLYSHVHTWGGLLGVPLVFVHLIWKSTLTTWKGARFPLLCLAVLLVGHAGWTAWRKGETEALSRLRYLDAEPAPRASAGAEGCGHVGCHSEITKQWSFSAHRYSAANLPYRKVAGLFEEEKGEGARRFCEGCHEPTLRLDEGGYSASRSDPKDVGVSCRACHLVESVHPGATNGKIAMAREQEFLPGHDPEREPIASVRHDFILDDLLFHRNTYQRDVLRSEEMCGSCHRLEIPPAPGRLEPLVLDKVVGSWKESKFAKEGIGCVHCHTQLHVFPDPDSSDIRGHSRPDHRFLGIDGDLSRAVPGEQVDADLARRFAEDLGLWFTGTLPVSVYERFFLWYSRNPRSLVDRQYFRDRQVLDLSVRPRIEKSVLGLDVTTANLRIGHTFPSGLLDLIRVWLEVTVTDVEGKVVASSGHVREDGTVDDSAPSLGARVLDGQGRPIRFHRVWAIARLEEDRVLDPGEKMEDRLEFRLPEGATPPFTIEARWWYRRYDLEFGRWVFGKDFRPHDQLLASERVSITSGSKVILP